MLPAPPPPDHATRSKGALTYACYPRQPESSTSALQKPVKGINLIILWYATLSLHHHYTPHLVVDELQGCKHVLTIWGLICNVISIVHHILWIACEWLLCLNYCVIIIVCMYVYIYICVCVCVTVTDCVCVCGCSNRNEYQEYFLGVKSSRCVRLTTLPPSWAIVT